MSDAPRPNRHPDSRKLNDFSQGRMTAGEWAELQSHLDACTECCDALASLADDGDPFVARIRRLAQQFATPISGPGGDGAGPGEVP